MDNDYHPPKPAASIATGLARAAIEPEEHGPDAMWCPIDSGPTTGAARSPGSWMRRERRLRVYVPLHLGFCPPGCGSRRSKTMAGLQSEAKMRPKRTDDAMGTKTDSPFSRAQKRLVQTSFAEVEPIAEAAAELFYNELFELDPGLEALFKTEITEQVRQISGDPHITSP